MNTGKWQDPRDKVLNVRYLALSLLATVLIAAGLAGRFFPEFLSPMGHTATELISSYWFVAIGLGAIIGAVNLYRTAVGQSEKPLGHP